jgi:hypothetical protein
MDGRLARCRSFGAKMAWRVTITFPHAVGDEDISLVHRVRNFGETLFRHFREDHRGLIALKDVDRATNSLVIERVRNRDLRRIVKLLEQMAAKEFPERTPEITTAKIPD